MRFGYVTFTDSSLNNLHLFLLDKDGQIIDDSPLYGNEEAFRGFLTHKKILFCEINSKELPDGHIAYKTDPILHVEADKKFRSGYHMLQRGDYEFMSKLFDDVYNVYIDKKLYNLKEGDIHDPKNIWKSV